MTAERNRQNAQSKAAESLALKPAPRMLKDTLDLQKATLQRPGRKPLTFLSSSLKEAQEYLGAPDSEIWRNPYVEEIAQLTVADHIAVDEVGIFQLSVYYHDDSPTHALLTWSDSPLSTKDWNTVKLQDLHETILGICNAVIVLTGLQPEKQRKLKAQFKTDWGAILVEGEERSYSAAGYLKKRSRTEL